MEAIQHHRVTSFGGVPTMITRVLDDPRHTEFDLSSVTTSMWGGSPPPSDLADKARTVFPSLNLIGNGYGLTETCGLCVYIAGTDLLERPTSAGRALPCVEVRIADLEGREVSAGNEGEVQIRGPVVMPRYWDAPDASAEAFAPGRWFRTGDLGYLDAEGYLFITGRLKDMIIRGGENIYPVEIEDALLAHESVLDAAVVGLPDPDFGEQVHAVIQVVRGREVTEDELRDHVKGRLAAFKVPASFELRLEPLPRNASGKLLKDALAADGRNRLTETL
jgi:long-chain acyl-CoA synthetase